MENDVCPTFFRYKTSSKQLENSESYRRSQRLFLQEEISFKTVEREKIIREIQLIRGDLRTAMSFLDWVHISNKFIEGNIRIVKWVEEVQNYKLAELLGNKLQHDPNKVIHQYSSSNWSKAEISLLLKGLNFSLPPKKLKFENYRLPFELLYRDVLHNESDITDSLIHLKSKAPLTGMHLNIHKKYASPILAFSQSTIYGLLIIENWKFSIGPIFLWHLNVKESKGDFCQFLADFLMILDTK